MGLLPQGCPLFLYTLIYQSDCCDKETWQVDRKYVEVTCARIDSEVSYTQVLEMSQMK